MSGYPYAPPYEMPGLAPTVGAIELDAEAEVIEAARNAVHAWLRLINAPRARKAQARMAHSLAICRLVRAVDALDGGR